MGTLPGFNMSVCGQIFVRSIALGTLSAQKRSSESELQVSNSSKSTDITSPTLSLLASYSVLLVKRSPEVFESVC